MCGALMSLDNGTTDDTTTDTDDDAFASGFGDATTTQPTETPAAGDDAQPEAAKEEAPAIEYAQLTKQEYEDLKARAALVEEIKATQEKSFGTAFGKIGGIERTLQQLQAGKKVEINQEDIDALRDDFPPLAAALEKVRDLSVIAPGLDEDAINKMVESRLTPRIQKIEMRMLAREHPDYAQIDSDPAFAAWIATQPDEFKQALATASAEYDSATVSDAMTKFKAHRKALQEAKPKQPDPDARKGRMSAAVTPRGTGQPQAASTDPFLDGFNSD